MEDTTPIRFASKAFSEYISNKLGVEEDKMTFELMKNQTDLTIDDKSVTSLEDLVCFPNITRLSLRNLRLKDLQGIENCKKIKDIYIYYSEVDSLEGIQNCINLERYDTTDSKIYEYKQLQECKNLKVFISENGNYNFENIIDMLKDKEKLTSVGMINNNITTVKSLQKLKNKENIKLLNLRDNNIEIIDGIEEYKSLEELNLDNNKIKDITALYTNENIKILSLKGNVNIKANRNEYNQEEIEKIDKIGKILDKGGKIYLDVDKLKLFTNYSDLDLSSQNLENLNCLIGMTNMKNLNLDNNRLTLADKDTQDVLKNLTKLEKLTLTNNPIQDISCLNEIDSLRTLTLRGVASLELNLKQIEDIISNITLSVTTPTFKTITNCDIEKITKISCITSYLTEIPDLSKFINLTNLDLSDNQSLNNIKNIENISSLEYLCLNKCNLHGRMINFSNLKNLTNLDLSNNILWDEDLENLKALKDIENLTINLSNNSIREATALLDLNQNTKINLSGNVNLTENAKTKLRNHFKNNVTF